ncbi:MAG: glycosyltransferase, partial [Wenzhouxiangellaceae bacterium]
ELRRLLTRLASTPDELRRRGEQALTLARREFDADRIYGDLADRLRTLARRSHDRATRRPLVGAATSGSAAASRGSAWKQALKETAVEAMHHRLRLPVDHWLRRRLRQRPQPVPNHCAWVITSRRDLFPTNHGAAVKIERTAWGLSFQVETVVLLTDRRDGYWIYRRGEREWRSFPVWMRIWGWPRAVNRARLIMRGLPASQTSLYLPLVDRGMHLRLMWLLSRYPVEVVSGEFPACAHPAVWARRLFGTKSVMVEHNVEFQRIADQCPELDEAARLWLKRVEVDLANACDQVITVSDRDRELLADAGVREGLIHTIPHGVDLTKFRDAAAFDWRTELGLTPEVVLLVYHGIYSYPPNLEAVEELSNRVLPALAQRGLKAQVLAIGPEPPNESLPGVTFTGPVDDLAARIKGADLAVMPLRKGGGTRMKILDYFAAGVPVISTAKGMEGLPIEPGRHLRV